MTKSWLNGAVVDATRATVSIDDRGFTVGEGAFETLLVRNGVPLALDRHLARLHRSLQILEIEGPSDDMLREGVTAVVQGSGIDTASARLRITVTRGSQAPTVAVTAVACHPYPPTATLRQVPWVRNERSPLAGAKTTSYAENLIALRHAQRHGADEAVLADSRGRLSECTTSNIFVVVAGEALTPSLACGALPGVTRELVLEWGGAIASVREAELGMHVLNEADEIFITSSLRGVQPVVRVNERTLATGPITHAIAQTYRAHMELEIQRGGN